MKQLLYRLRAALDAFKYPGTVRMEFDNETLGRLYTTESIMLVDTDFHGDRLVPRCRMLTGWQSRAVQDFITYGR